LGAAAGVGQRLPVIFLPVIRITGRNEIVNIPVEKSRIPGPHQLFRGGWNGLTRKIGPAARVTFVPAFTAAERFRHSFPPFARHGRYLISNPLFHYCTSKKTYHGSLDFSTFYLPDPGFLMKKTL